MNTPNPVNTPNPPTTASGGAAAVLRRAVPWALLVALYLAARLPGLGALPPFLDEVGHARWSKQIARGEKVDKPWQYGKGLGIFAGALVVPGARDPVLAARGVTVALGWLTVVGVALAGRELFGAAVGALAAALYVFTPFALFHERLFLTDPHGAAFSTLALWTSASMARRGRRSWAVASGLLLALAIFSKALGVLFAGLPVLAALLLAEDGRKAWRAAAVACGTLALVAGWPLVQFLQTTSTVRVAVTKDEGDLLARLASNVPLLGNWLFELLTAPLAGLVVAGLLLAVLRRSRPAAYVALAAALPLTALVGISTLWFPRYVVPAVAPLAVLAAWALAEGAKAIAFRTGARFETLAGLGLLLALGPALRFDHELWTSPDTAPLTEIDRQQFVDGWPSGYGVDETLRFLETQARSHPTGITVVTHSGARRTTAWAIQLAYQDDARFRLEDVDLLAPNARWALEDWASRQPTYLVVSPSAPGRKPPDPSRWEDLGPVVHRNFKPDGSKCDVVYRLCSAAGCGGGPGVRPARP